MPRSAEASVGGQRGALRDRQPVTFVAARQRLRRHRVLITTLIAAPPFASPAGASVQPVCSSMRWRQRGSVAQVVTLQRQRQAVIQHQRPRRLRHLHLLRRGISGRSPAGCASAPQENHNDEASSV